MHPPSPRFRLVSAVDWQKGDDMEQQYQQAWDNHFREVYLGGPRPLVCTHGLFVIGPGVEWGPGAGLWVVVGLGVGALPHP